MRYLVTVIFCFIFSFTAFASDVQVVDGDTLKIDGITYRLHGIDAPEHGQTCNKKGGGTWECGNFATKVLQAEIYHNGPIIKCLGSETDAGGRVIATCYAGETSTVDIAHNLVGIGVAWAFRKFSNDYVDVEERSKKQKWKIWQAETQTPWDYRAEKWQNAIQETPNGCPVKGSLSPDGKIYHVPWSPSYKDIVINSTKGEKWFCSEAEALEAGWRAPLWGK